MAVNTEQGFLDNTINVESDFGLGEQSVLLGKEALEPSQPYKFTTVQETIPSAPPISVGGGFDPYSANDLSSIISPLQIRSKLKKDVKKNVSYVNK
jgi:hypothetical protein